MKSKVKGLLSIFLILCSVFQLVGPGVRAKGEIIATDTYYVGGFGASDENSGISSVTPLATISRASSLINSKGVGSYKIIVQGEIVESKPIKIGDGVNPIQVNISNAVTGSAIVMRGIDMPDDFIVVENSATLTLGDETGATSEQFVLDGRNYIYQGAAINVKEGANLEIFSNVTILNHDNRTATGSGGAIYNFGTVALNGGSIQSNSSYYGGAIYNKGTLFLRGGSLSSNRADSGGGIYNSGTVYMTGGLIDNNQANKGGGIYNVGNLVMDGGTISDNFGAIHSLGSISLSGDARIPWNGVSNGIYLNHYINILSKLNSRDKIMLAPELFNPGQSVLMGDSETIASSYMQFEFWNQKFGIDSTGKVIDGQPIYCYVGGENASDENTGTDPSLPLASLSNAISKASKGSILIITLQSDITVNDTIYIKDKDITIQSDGSNRKIIPISNAKYQLFVVDRGTLKLGGGRDDSSLSIQDVEIQVVFQNYEKGRLIFEEGFTVSNSKMGHLVLNEGVFNIEGGSYNNNEFYGWELINNQGTMTMTGGTIEYNNGTDTSYYATTIRNENIMYINGGSIVNNQLTGVLNYESLSFNSGSITDNAIDIRLLDVSNLTISGDVMVDTIHLLNSNNVIQIGSDLVSDKIITIMLDGYPVGKEILKGDLSILQANHGKFVLDDTNYRINEAGKLEYIGETIPVYYVGGIAADDGNGGTTAETSFATINKAVRVAGNSPATIIIQSDLTITDGIVITGSITILSDGTTHTISRGLYYKGEMFYVAGKLILGNSDFSDSDSSPDLIIDGGSRDNTTADGPIISSVGNLYIYPGVALQYNNNTLKSSSSASGIHNIGGAIYMYGGIIRNNTTYGATIYNDRNASFILVDGNINNNEGGTSSGVYVVYGSSFLMEGGSINNNISREYSGVHVRDGSTFIMKGGTISGNNDKETKLSRWGTDYYMGSGVCVIDGSTFTMDGGTISNNSVDERYKPAGVFVFDSSFIMNEGSITDNTGGLCAGVYICSRNDSYKPVFIMNNGNISDNKSNEIAGVCSIKADVTVNAGLISKNIGIMSGIISEYSDVVINGGSISENKADMIAGIMNNVLDSGRRERARILMLSGRSTKTGTLKLYGGLVENNKSKYSGVLAMDKIQMSGDTIIRGGDKLIFLYFPPEYGYPLEAGIELLSEMADSSPDINIATYTYSEEDYRPTTTYIPVNTQLVYSGNGYEFTKEDISKLKLESEEYAINIEGRVGRNLKDDWVTLSEFSDLFYDKDEKTIKVTINDGLKTLTASEDFDVLYENNVNAGNAQITIWGKGGYAGTLYQSFTINPRKLSEEWVIKSDTNSIYYDGKEKKVSIIISDDNKELTKDVDYTVSYSNNTEIGDAEVRIEGIGNYSGIIIEGFRISKNPTPPAWPIYYSPGPITPDKPKETTEIAVTLNDGRLTVDINKMPEGSIDEQKDEIVLRIPTKDILDQIAKEEVKDAMIRLKEDEKLSGDSKKKKTLLLKAEVLEAAKDTKKNLSVSVEDDKGRERYTWNFSSDEINSSQKDLEDVNLYLEVHETEITEINSDIDTKDTKGLLIDFAHEGELPSQANVRIYVGDIKDIKPASRIYLYHINKESGLMESLPFSSGYEVDEDGYISVNILHCSDYAVFSKELSGDLVSSLRNQISISIDKKTIYAGGNIDASAWVFVKLPPTLEIVESLKSETSQTAIGGVTVSYRSSNKKVASVDGEGRIIANNKGKASIYATVTLYNGKSKVVKLNIDVKEAYIKMTKSRDIMELGSSYRYSVKAYGLDIKDLMWSTKRKSIVVINKDTGLATAKSKGTDYVVATIKGVSKVIKVVVE